MDKNRIDVLDLVIQNGQVFDVETRTFKRQDIGVSDGKIAAVSERIAVHEKAKVIDASGCVVAPGLIDMHCHIYPNFPGEDDGLPTIHGEAHMFRSGVTTAVDAGTCGCRDFWYFKENYIDPSKLRIFAFVNIAERGMVGFPSEQNPSEFLPYTAAAIAKEANCVVGIKTAHYWVGIPFDKEHPAWASVDSAVLAGELCGKPVMVDFQPNLPERTYEELVLEKLRRGDIHTHIYAQQFPILDSQGKVNDFLFEARRRGVIFDLGHGAGSFWFRNAVPSYEQGFYPDTISTDLYADNMNGPVFNLLHIMSKYLAIGMPLEEILYRTTKRPAEIIGHPELGDLQIGRVADIAVLKVEKTEIQFADSGHASLPGSSRLECLLTVRNGEIVYNPMAMGMPYWKDAEEPYWHSPGVLP